jgi:hypothetical protein
MYKKNSTSGIIFGLTIFAGLLPLAFMFTQKGTQLLLETSFKYVVWGGQTGILFLLTLTKHKLSKKQLIGLAILCAVVPFTFTFNEKGVSFLILNKYTSSLLSWAIAGVLLIKMFTSQKLKENSDF